MSTQEQKSSLRDHPTFKAASQARLKALYSDFSRQKASNPASYRSNVDWWKNAFTELSNRGLQPNAGSEGLLTLEVSSELAEHLRYEGVGKPLGLGTVLTELRKEGDLIPLSEFLTSSHSIYDEGSLAYRVGSYVVGRPLWWALEQLSLVSSEEDVVESEASMWKKAQGTFVVRASVERAAERILELQQKRSRGSASDSLYTFELFKKEFGKKDQIIPGQALSHRDLNVLVKYLSRDKYAIVVDAEIIKFVQPDSPESRQPVTEADRGVAELRAAVDRVEAQVEETQRRIDERTAKLNEALRSKRREDALIFLRLRKHLEKQLSQRLGVLENLHSMLVEVDIAASNIDTMKAYELSTATLKSILAHPSLQRDKVDEVLNAMAAATDEHRELSEEIKIGLESTQDTTIDEDEIAAELADLVEEAKVEDAAKARKAQEAEEQALAQRLPSAPEGVPEADKAAAQEKTSGETASAASDESEAADPARQEAEEQAL